MKASAFNPEGQIHLEVKHWHEESPVPLEVAVPHSNAHFQRQKLFSTAVAPELLWELRMGIWEEKITNEFF